MEFNKAYNRQEFIGFLKNRFLPEDFVQKEENVEFVTQTKYSTQAVKLGTCESLDLVVYEIRHTSKNDARVSLSKEAFRLLTDEMEDRALVAFVPEDNDATYRFSLIEISLNIDEEHSRITRSYSNPRRYSYLLGEGISYSSFGSKNSVLYAVCASWLSNAILRLSAMTCLSTVSSSHSSISATMQTTSSIASQMQSMTVISLNPRYVSLNRPPIVS